MPTVTIDSTTQRYTSGPHPEPDILLLHTTEGMGWPGYNGGGYAPHDTVRPIPGVGIEVRRHYRYDQYAKALVNKDGGPQTNRRGVIQVELRGTCDPKHRGDPRWYFWPDADDAVLSALADYYRPIMAKYGIPARAMAPFVAYPRSYGATSTRLTTREWDAGSGICGHQHAPENTHGDPGNFPIARFIAFLTKATPSPEEDDMPTPAELWRADIIPSPDGNASNPTWRPDSYLRETFRQARAASTATRELTAQVAALTALVSQIAASQPGQTLTADEITAAAKAGAASALDEKITGAEVTLEVQP